MYSNDKRTVITLDAGGTNFAFGAIKGNKFIVDPIILPSNADDLDRCLETMVEGFSRMIDKLDEKPVAISFAFPGPADYPNGIIGGYLPNFPSFRDGVALGPFLEDKFGIPVYINNDADLYAYGEALAGALPELNQRLTESGSSKQFRNLLGFTFGTGFGFGFVTKGELHIGDNSCVETFCLRHKHMPNVMVEEGVSIRAVKRVYAEESGSTDITLTPKDIFEIAEGRRAGDAEAAQKAFAMLGEVAGDAMATAATLIDGVIVIGGGLSAAAKYIKPALLKEMRSKIHTMQGGSLNRVQMKVYDLDNDAEFEDFVKGESRTIKVYGSEREVSYDPQKRIGISFSKIGANAATSMGAYAFALNELDKTK
ncbi:MAG: ROK family protein [Rikenellaceae bacterium]|nr:ROK family protein [Rikenellaceae bacterium]